jgi:CMP/dCMP kinase
MAQTIAISRQRGSGGAFVGRALADRLGYRYIDREMLRDAAEYLSAQDSQQSVTTSARSWWDRLGRTFGLGGPDCGYIPPTSDDVYEGELFEIQKRLIREIDEGQPAVIVGRGAAQMLRGRPGVISVFLHAPDANRIQRVKAVYHLADAHAAQKMVHDSDRDRARFIHALAAIEWTDSRVYDLAIDTAAIGLEMTIDLLARAAGADVTGHQSPVASHTSAATSQKPEIEGGRTERC